MILNISKSVVIDDFSCTIKRNICIHIIMEIIKNILLASQ